MSGPSVPPEWSRDAESLKNWPYLFAFQCIQEFDFKQHPDQNFRSSSASPHTVVPAGLIGKILEEDRGRGLYKISVRRSSAARYERWIPKQYVTVWPEGWPFRARVDYNANGIRMRTGDIGEIEFVQFPHGQPYGAMGEAQLPWFQVKINGTQGFIEYWAAEPGNVNSRYIVTAIADISPNLSAGLQSNTLPQQQDNLWKILYGICIAFKNGTSQGLILPHRLREIVNNQQLLGAFVQKIHNGVNKAGLLWLFNTRQFTIQQLIRKAKKIGPRTLGAGIYGKCYKDFRMIFKGWGPMLYIGKSVELSARMGRHDNDRPKIQSSKHYEAANDSTDPTGDNFIVCELDRDDNEMKLVEQIFTSLFNSYHPTMTSFEPEVITAEGSTDSTRRYGDIEQATIAYKLAMQVFQLTGWTSYCGHASFGVSQGLNRSSPMHEGQDNKTIIWTLSHAPGRMSVYQRHAFRVTIDDNTATVLKIGWKDSDGNITRFGVTVPTKIVKPGTLVYPAIEISEDGPHPAHYAKISALGPLSDWEDARRLAVRVTFYEDGKWQHIYPQSQANATFQENSGSSQLCRKYVVNPLKPLTGPDYVAGVLTTYVRTIRVFRYLKQITVIDDYPWMPHNTTARVKEVVPRAFESQLEIRGKTANVPPQPRAKAIAFSELVARLQNAGAGNIKTFMGSAARYGGPTGRWGKPPIPRKVCDACFLILRLAPTASASTASKCIKLNNQGCINCNQRGIPCSWTDGMTKESKPDLWDLLCEDKEMAGGRHYIRVPAEDPEMEQIYEP
ncbi:hypothetical protein EDD36DRAFT_493319 [Exophiala viscosa]|uniref:Uncharacterized protein n=1 Tax=Exophiala viscosa TaxID=2486360 RepID=A0AAN6IGP9_9EURO|nr:hypothetical protein EDD36DRAFT_493319 [Exophiala viscosa]